MGNSATKQTVRGILASVPLNAEGLLTNLGTVITIDSHASLATAYQTLLNHHILSAPVWDAAAQKYIGIVDMRDLVSFCVGTYEADYKDWVAQKKDHKQNLFEKKECEHKEPTAPAGKIISLLGTSAPDSKREDEEIHAKSDDEGSTEKWPLKEFFAKVKERQVKVQQVVAKNVEENKSRKEISLLINLSMRNSFQSVQSSDNLLHVAEILASGAHAVPVMDRDSKTITNIITQSTLINFLSINKAKELQQFLKEPIGELGTSPVVAVGHKSTVYSVLKVLDDRYISGVAIVDTDCNNKLIGTFSGSDLRGWFQPGQLSFNALTKSVVEFLKNRKMIPGTNKEDTLLVKSAASHLPKKERPKVISCVETNTLAQLVELFDKYKVHRVYVTHPLKESVQSIVCLKDLLRRLVSMEHLNKDGIEASKLHVCDCHHCRGRYSYTKQATVDSHIHKYGKYTPWWSYQLFGMIPFPVAIPPNMPMNTKPSAKPTGTTHVHNVKAA